ncbi:hypothetical protein [Clavibacter michiganensis]|uniref:Uncharacterized protein n=1 Tax=Clavibacter michiganensis TaxID=28447 RepID=A0A251YNX5_9MICO|nr:hypothetical protein [Clavibacter michiganensis]OUE25940.1 hypothetical protein BFL37_05545 [Clavibacter michiganensis]
MRDPETLAMAGRGTRVVRGTVTAAFAILVSMLSHLAGGGPVPGAVGLVLAAALAVPTCVLLAGRTVSTARLALAVASSQAVLHLLFSVGAPTSTTMRVVGGHHGMGGHLISTGSAATGAADMGGMHHGSSMWIAHLLAAVLTIAALRSGERAFWDLVALARTRLRVLIRVASLEVVPRAEVRHRVARSIRAGIRDLGVCVAALPHRGPPAAA